MLRDKIDFIKRETCPLHSPTASAAPALSIRARAYDAESKLGYFDIKFCEACQVGLTDPYPSEETSPHLYETKDSSDFDLIQTGWLDGIKDALGRRVLKIASPFSELNRVRNVLDYSCGNGRFSMLAHDLFSQAQIDGVDYQQTPPVLFSSRPSPRIRYLTVNQFEEADRKYDLIVLRHVLEHTYHPVELIKDLGSRLQPEGIIYIEVPNLNSRCASIFGSRWKGYYVPRHVFHFTPHSLQLVLKAAGLQGTIQRKDLPLMGNMVSILFGLKTSNRFAQIAGVALHPLQLLIEGLGSSSTCLSVRARRL